MRVMRNYTLVIGIFTILAIVFFITRLYHLTSLPIFTDEAIYLRWAQIAKNDATWRFISLTDGKQPMFVWLVIPFMKFIHDPLMAGRAVSVMAGFFSLVGLFFLGKELFKSMWVGLLAAFLYLIFPMGVVYDRMALYDSLVAAFSVWALYGEILLVKKNRLDIAFILAFILGGAMLTKTNGFFSAAFLPITFLLFDWSKKERGKRFLRLCVYSVIAVIVANIYYSVLRLSPFFHIIDEKNAIFVYPLKEWLLHPFLNLWENTKAIATWSFTYLTLPFVFLLFASFFFAKRFWKEIAILWTMYLIFISYFSLFGKVIYPRHMFFSLVLLFPLIAFSFYMLLQITKKRAVQIGLFLLIITFPLWSSFKVLTDFGNAPIPQSDLDQYANSWPAGGGVKEAVSYLTRQAENRKIYVGTEGTFGLMPYALELYLYNNSNVKITGIWPVKDEPPQELISASKTIPTYTLFYQPCPSCAKNGIAPQSWPLRPVLQVKKGNTENYLTVYQVIPK